MSVARRPDQAAVATRARADLQMSKRCLSPRMLCRSQHIHFLDPKTLREVRQGTARVWVGTGMAAFICGSAGGRHLCARGRRHSVCSWPRCLAYHGSLRATLHDKMQLHHIIITPHNTRLPAGADRLADEAAASYRCR